MGKGLSTQYVKNAKPKAARAKAKSKAEQALCKTFHGDSGGLFLKVSDSGGKSWVFKWRVRGTDKQKVMGLGSYPDVSLADARELATDARRLAIKGEDPLTEREAERAAKLAALHAGENAPDVMTFDKCAELFIKKMVEPTSKPGAKTVAQWRSSLKEYASPFIGSMDVNDITTDDMEKLLAPIWYEINETASRVRSRCENILDWAKVKKYRTGPNPATWQGNLMHLFKTKKKVSPVEHYSALPYSDMPKLYSELCEKSSLTALALRFTILTACRTGETIGAEWTEFKNCLWEIPAERMKAGEVHVVPLSTEVIRVLDQLDDSGQYVFPGGNYGKGKGHMSNIAQLKLLKELRPDVTVHGCRSSFRDWCAEETNYPNHIAEMALAHIVKGVEGAYRRGDLLEKRAALMQDWANYLTA